MKVYFIDSEIFSKEKPGELMHKETNVKNSSNHYLYNLPCVNRDLLKELIVSKELIEELKESGQNSNYSSMSFT